MTDNKVIVEAIGLTKIYGSNGEEVRALDNVNFRIHQAEFVAVMGPSGSRQIDAAQHDRRAGQADRGPGDHRRARSGPAARSGQFPRQDRGLRVPDAQLDPHADGDSKM